MLKKSIFLIPIFSIIFNISFLNGQTFKEVSFVSEDQLEVTADLFHFDKKAPTIIMFHQSVSSRGEYRTIAPKLQARGFNCLAVDLRWGKQDFWNKVPNKTAERNGTYPVIANYKNTEDYQVNKVWPIIFSAYQEMEASVNYLKSQGYEKEILVMGSSFSAMMVFKLAKENQDIDGILAFSPGEYYSAQQNLLSSWLKETKVPVYLSAGKSEDEVEMVSAVKKALYENSNTSAHFSKGRHGASVLIDRKEDWPPLLKFLDQFKNTPQLPVAYEIIYSNRPNSIYHQDSTGMDSINSKPIPIHLWFPTDNLANKKMTYQDYTRHLSKDKTPAENIDVFKKMLQSFNSNSSSVSEEDLEKLLHLKTNAFNNKSHDTKNYPLVLILGGHPFYHLELAETISSNGYVVASIPRIGIKKGQRLAFDASGTKELKKDIDFVISTLEESSFINVENVSIVAWSFEGIASYEYAIERPTIKTILSLDSSLGYNYGSNLITNEAVFYEKGHGFNMIHYTGNNMDHGKDFSLIEKLKSCNDKVSIEKSFDFNHAEFTSITSLTIPIMYHNENDKYSEFVKDLLSRLSQSN